MFEYGIARRLVTDIPEHLGKKKICDNSSWRMVVFVIPEKRCSFNDDDLDFSDYNNYTHNYKMKVKISHAPIDCRLHVKCWILNNIDSGSKPSTQVSKCSQLSRILKRAEESSDAHCLADVGTQDIVKAINELWPYNHTRRIQGYRIVISFLDFINDEMETCVPVDMRRLEKEKQFLIDMMAGFGEKRHSPVLDDMYTDHFVDGLNKIMRDDKRTFNERSTAGMALLNTQLGLRVSEIPALEVDCLRKMVCNDGKERPYIVYNCLKKARGDVKVVKIKTICTPVAKETIEYLIQLRRLAGEEIEKNHFLYVLKDENSRKGKVVGIPKYCHIFHCICAYYLADLVSSQHCNIKPLVFHKKKYWIPGMHSFRSTFADRLYRLGFNIDYINCIMSHTHNESDACNMAYIPSIKKNSTTDIENALSDMMDDKLYN